MRVGFFSVVLCFQFTDEILKCVRLDESCAVVIPYVAVYCAAQGGSHFLVSG